MPVTASTATIRAWAQSEGLDVGDRGRLKPEILDAYQAAHARKPTNKPSKTTPRSARSTPAPAPLQPRVATATPKQGTPRLATLLAEPAEPEAPATKGADVIALQEALDVLAARVSKLEATAEISATKRRFGRKT